MLLIRSISGTPLKSFHRVMGNRFFVEVTPEHEMINNC
jgi:hypothetical protein